MLVSHSKAVKCLIKDLSWPILAQVSRCDISSTASLDPDKRELAGFAFIHHSGSLLQKLQNLTLYLTLYHLFDFLCWVSNFPFYNEKCCQTAAIVVFKTGVNCPLKQGAMFSD